MNHSKDLFEIVWQIVDINWTFAIKRNWRFGKQYLFCWYHLIDSIKICGFSTDIDRKLSGNHDLRQLYFSKDIRQFLFHQCRIYHLQINNYNFEPRPLTVQLKSKYFLFELLKNLLKEYDNLKFSMNLSDQQITEIEDGIVQFLGTTFTIEKKGSYLIKSQIQRFVWDFNVSMKNIHQFAFELLDRNYNSNMKHGKAKADILQLLPRRGNMIDWICHTFDYQCVCQFQDFMCEYVLYLSQQNKSLVDNEIREFCCVLLYIVIRNVYCFESDSDNVIHSIFKAEKESDTIDIFNFLFDGIDCSPGGRNFNAFRGIDIGISTNQLWEILNSYPYEIINNNNFYNTRVLRLKPFGIHFEFEENEYDINQDSDIKHDWDNVINFWKWNEKYDGVSLKNDGSYSEDQVKPMFILDIAVLTSTWLVIENMIRKGILDNMTTDQHNFYNQNVRRLKLPPCVEIKDYQQYTKDREIIWKNLETELSSRKKQSSLL